MPLGQPSKPSTKLSASALSYLSSLESSSKALQNSLKTDKPESNSNVSKTKPEPLKNQRSRALSKSTTNADSSSFDSSPGGEKIILDLGFDHQESHESNTNILPKGKPGKQMGRKSLVEIRELRNSIDQSLKPTLILLQKKIDPKTSSNVAKTLEASPERQFAPIKGKQSTKSPFKAQSNSDSSDLESLVFEVESEIVEDIPNEKKKPFKNLSALSISSISSRSTASDSTSSSSSSSSSSTETTDSSTARTTTSTASSTSASSSSTSSSSSKSSSSASSSSSTITSGSKTKKVSSSSSSSSRSSSTLKPSSRIDSALSELSSLRESNEDIFHSPPSNREQIVQNGKKTKPDEPRANSVASELSELSLQKISKEKKKKPKEFNKKLENIMCDETTQTSPLHQTNSLFNQRTIWDEPHLFQLPTDLTTANLDYFLKHMISQHIYLVRDFNEREWNSIREWTRILDDDIRFCQPSTKAKLFEIIQKRVMQK